LQPGSGLGLCGVVENRDRLIFNEDFREALEPGGALVVLDRKSGKVIGASRYFW